MLPDVRTRQLSANRLDNVIHRIRVAPGYHQVTLGASKSRLVVFKDAGLNRIAVALLDAALIVLERKLDRDYGGILGSN